MIPIVKLFIKGWEWLKSKHQHISAFMLWHYVPCKH